MRNESEIKVREIIKYKDPKILAKTLIIKVKIGDEIIEAIVDSGAQVSVISRDLVEKLKKEIKLSDFITLKGAERQSNFQARITDGVKVEIGKIKTKWKFIAANISDNIILGMDFLDEHKAVIDLSNYSIKLNQESIPISCIITENGQEVNIYRINLQKRTVVPPNSAILTPVQANRELKKDLVIQPSLNLKGLLSPNLLLPCEEKAQILLKNTTDHFINLKKDQEYGVGIEVDTVLEDPSVPEVCINEIKMDRHSVNPKNNDRQSVIPEKTLGKLQNQIPSYLTDLFVRSAKQFDVEQKIKIASLLIKFQDTFAKNDFDLGLFNGDIKHRIHTGDAPAVRQNEKDAV